MTIRRIDISPLLTTAVQMLNSADDETEEWVTLCAFAARLEAEHYAQDLQREFDAKYRAIKIVE